MKDKKLTALEMGRMSPEQYKQKPESGLVLVLDNVRSAYNVGSAFRSADAFGADAVYLCGICATPPSNEIHKTALGAEESVSWEHGSDTLDTVSRLKAEGYTIVSVEQTQHSVKLVSGGIRDVLGANSSCGDNDEGALAGKAKYALIFGNEVEGIQQSVVDASDFCLEIPQHGTKHSLNVSVTVGIVLFAFTANK